MFRSREVKNRPQPHGVPAISVPRRVWYARPAQEQKEKRALRFFRGAPRGWNAAKDRHLTHEGAAKKISTHNRTSGGGKSVDNRRTPPDAVLH